MRVSHFGKMGDMVYALPAIRALARIHGPVHITTSPLCWQMLPLLWEQPYIREAWVDGEREYKMDNGIFNFWEYYAEGEGLNISSQPKFFEDGWPLSWTGCYARAAGVNLEPEDFCIFPALQNQRRYLRSCDVKFDGEKQELPKYVVIAPESETLGSHFDWYKLENLIRCKIVVIGNKLNSISTTVPTLARIIADAAGFIGAHSFPWHLARHLEVPAVCLQPWRPGLLRCIPVDTPYYWYEPEDYVQAVEKLSSLMENDHAEGKVEKSVYPGQAITAYVGGADNGARP